MIIKQLTGCSAFEAEVGRRENDFRGGRGGGGGECGLEDGPGQSRRACCMHITSLQSALAGWGIPVTAESSCLSYVEETQITLRSRPPYLPFATHSYNQIFSELAAQAQVAGESERKERARQPRRATMEERVRQAMPPFLRSNSSSVPRVFRGLRKER